MSNKSKDKTSKVEQDISGDSHHISGRDYYETINYYLFGPNSIKQRLDNLSKSEIDVETVEKEDVFLYRFGFFHRIGRLPCPAVRKEIVRLANERKWTDRETCRLQNIPGHLVFTRNEVKIEPSNKMLWMGRLHLLVCVILTIAFVFRAVVSDATAERKVLELTVLGFSLSFITLALNAMYFELWSLTHLPTSPSAETPHPIRPPNLQREGEYKV